MREYDKILQQRKGQLQQTECRLDTLHERLMSLQREQKDCEQAQVVIQKVAQLTQEELKYHVSELVTLALAAVFDDPYQFEIDFVQRRGQTECDLWFVRDGKRIDPMNASGGGAQDVASFALRVSLWSLKSKRTRPILILDEPMTALKGEDLPEKGARLLKEISEKLKLQIIYVSHSPEQIESADGIHSISIKKGVSKCVSHLN